MDRNNKYYGIIENLIKQNRKYPGYEAILDDIIDDVYSHSEVIIQSINNDNVIKSYLERVIATSLITVPKKMNFHNEIRHATISTSAVVSPQKELSKDIPVNQEYVERMINSAQGSIYEKEKPLVGNYTEELDIDTELLETQDLSADEPVQTEVEDFGVEIEPEELVTEDLSIDEPVPDEAEDFSVENVDEFNTEDLELEFTTEEEDIENDLIESASELEITSDALDLIPDDDTELVSEAGILSDEESLETDDLNLIEVQSESIIDDLIDKPAADFEIVEDHLENDLSFEENKDFSSESNDILDIISENTDKNSEQEELPNNSLELPDYTKFEFEQPYIDYDASKIVKSLVELDSARPELNILKIYEMKYKQSKNVDEIASELNIGIEKVVFAINAMFNIL